MRSVDYRHTGMKYYSPPGSPKSGADINVLVIEEEVFVESA